MRPQETAKEIGTTVRILLARATEAKLAMVAYLLGNVLIETDQIERQAANSQDLTAPKIVLVRDDAAIIGDEVDLPFDDITSGKF